MDGHFPRYVKLRSTDDVLGAHITQTTSYPASPVIREIVTCQ